MNVFLDILAEYYRTGGGAVGDAAAGNGLPALHAAASADQLFGPLSHYAGTGDAAAFAVRYAGGFSATTMFHAVTVLLLICYVLVMYRHPELLKTLQEHIFSPGGARDQHRNDNRHDPLRGFSWGRLLLDTLFVCTAAVRLTDTLAPSAADSLPAAARMLAVPVVAGLYYLTVAYQSGLLALTGTVTVSRPLTSALGRTKTVYFRLATVVLTPVLLLWALCPTGEGRAFAAAIALLGLFIALAFLRETFLLFISKKLSIYHWILYLCTVEAFPVSFVWLLAARG